MVSILKVVKLTKMQILEKVGKHFGDQIAGKLGRYGKQQICQLKAE